MKKLVENLAIDDYMEVNDMFHELLKDTFGIERYDFDSLETGVEYVLQGMNIVKLGDKKDTLKHLRHREWSEDIPANPEYRYYSIYYRKDALESLCEKHLSGSWSETYHFQQALKERGGNTGSN